MGPGAETAEVHLKNIVHEVEDREAEAEHRHRADEDVQRRVASEQPVAAHLHEQVGKKPTQCRRVHV